MPIFTTTVSIYCPVRDLSAAKEPLSEGWQLVAADVPADIQPALGSEEISPLGYSATQVVECFFGPEADALLAVGYLIVSPSGDCRRVISPPEIWEIGSKADHVAVRAESTPTPASLTS